MIITIILVVSLLLQTAGFITAVYFISGMFIKQINHMCYLAITGNPERAAELSKTMEGFTDEPPVDEEVEGEKLLHNLGY